MYYLHKRVNFANRSLPPIKIPPGPFEMSPVGAKCSKCKNEWYAENKWSYIPMLGWGTRAGADEQMVIKHIENLLVLTCIFALKRALLSDSAG